jgi:cobalt-zinc-cadmium efflux system outer membrane protein
VAIFTPVAQAFTFLLSASADSLTLADALERARTTRPQVAVAAATVERARGAKRVATIIPNPSAQFEADDQSPTRKLVITQSLAWLPRRGADLTAGRAGIARAAADSAQLMAMLAREVRGAFYGALAANELLRIAETQSILADSLVRLADRRVAAGDIASIERDQIAQEAVRARLFTSQAREAAGVADAELRRAVAWASDSPIVPQGRLEDALHSAGANDVVLPPDMHTLPLLRAATADSAMAAARLTSARLAQLPMPAFIAGREWNSGTAAVRDNVILGLSMPLPFWTQGRESTAEAAGVAHEARARAAETRLTLTAQIAAARARAGEAERRARLAHDTLWADAQRMREGAVRLYDSGRTNIVVLFDALRTERDAARTMVQELLAFQNARAEFLALLGRWK